MVLAAAIAQPTGTNHAVLLVKKSGHWSCLDDGAFTPDASPPKHDEVRLLLYTRREDTAAEGAPAPIVPPRNATRLRTPLGGMLGRDSDEDSEGRPAVGENLGGGPASWIMVPLLAAAARARTHAAYSVLAVAALGPRLFSDAVALIRRCGAAPAPQRFDEVTGYLGAEEQERCWATVQRQCSAATPSAEPQLQATRRAVEQAVAAGPPHPAPRMPSLSAPAPRASQHFQLPGRAAAGHRSPRPRRRAIRRFGRSRRPV